MFLLIDSARGTALTVARLLFPDGHAAVAVGDWLAVAATEADADAMHKGLFACPRAHWLGTGGERFSLQPVTADEVADVIRRHSLRGTWDGSAFAPRREDA